MTLDCGGRGGKREGKERCVREEEGRRGVSRKVVQTSARVPMAKDFSEIVELTFWRETQC